MNVYNYCKHLKRYKNKTHLFVAIDLFHCVNSNLHFFNFTNYVFNIPTVNREFYKTEFTAALGVTISDFHYTIIVAIRFSHNNIIAISIEILKQITISCVESTHYQSFIYIL